MSYLHSDHEEQHISLHDCMATEARLENGELIFVFQNGITVGCLHPENPYRKPILTDAAEVRYHLATERVYDVYGYVFEQKTPEKAIRRSYDIKRLIEDLNQKHCRLEFLYQYVDGNQRIVKCQLWSEKKPYIREFELFLHTSEVLYLWNTLRKETLDCL